VATKRWLESTTAPTVDTMAYPAKPVCPFTTPSRYCDINDSCKLRMCHITGCSCLSEHRSLLTAYLSTVDWAALAKQWMQYKEPMTQESSTPPPPPPPEAPTKDDGMEIEDSEPAPKQNWQGSWNTQGNGHAHNTWGNTGNQDWSAMQPEVCSTCYKMSPY